jgi:phage shock protein PspC (stress-responsive transcriptional regulator)
MNEITRIHIAKIPLNIELAAKKALDAYLRVLESYLNDVEVFDDIEQRIVELLQERNIKVDGVIALSDVEAIKIQLGDPEEFLSEARQTLVPAKRRLFRDPSQAILGGVASGLAIYFGAPVWVLRVLIVLLALGSFGMALLVYLLLWIVIPPVSTAADRLLLEGKPVTVSAMQQINEAFGSLANNRDKSAIRVVTFVLGLGFTLATIGAIIASAFGAYGLLFHDASTEGYYGFSGHEMMYSLTSLFSLSGLLLAGLFSLLAYISFTQRLSRKLYITAATIIVLGLVSFGAGIGLTYQANRHQMQYLNDHTKQTTVQPTGDLYTATSLIVTAPQANIEYVVSDESKVLVTAFADTAHKKPQTSVTIANGVASVRVNGKIAIDCVLSCGQYMITIYGPAMKTITIADGAMNYTTKTQESLAVTVKANQSFTITDGIIASLTATLEKNATINALDASIDRVTMDNNAIASASLGNVKDLTITNNLSCPTAVNSQVDVDGISGSLILNGTPTTVASTRIPCLEIRLSDATE